MLTKKFQLIGEPGPLGTKASFFEKTDIMLEAAVLFFTAASRY